MLSFCQCKCEWGKRRGPKTSGWLHSHNGTITHSRLQEPYADITETPLYLKRLLTWAPVHYQSSGVKNTQRDNFISVEQRFRGRETSQTEDDTVYISHLTVDIIHRVAIILCRLSMWVVQFIQIYFLQATVCGSCKHFSALAKTFLSVECLYKTHSFF